MKWLYKAHSLNPSLLVMRYKSNRQPFQSTEYPIVSYTRGQAYI